MRIIIISLLIRNVKIYDSFIKNVQEENETNFLRVFLKYFDKQNFPFTGDSIAKIYL
jgi:hypothetical protein